MNPVCLNEKTRRARKPHRCNLCGGEIKKGTEYDLQTFVYGGTFYGWKMHPECNAVSSFLWDYVDPDEGMTADEFLDACSSVCRTFACPDCEHFDADGASDGDYCKEDRSFCIHKLYELAQAYRTSAGTWSRYDGMAMRDCLGSVVRHWMPLPPVPKDGGSHA